MSARKKALAAVPAHDPFDTAFSMPLAAKALGGNVSAEHSWQVLVVPPGADPVTHPLLHFFNFPGSTPEAAVLDFVGTFRAQGLRAEARRITHFKAASR